MGFAGVLILAFLAQTISSLPSGDRFLQVRHDSLSLPRSDNILHLHIVRDVAARAASKAPKTAGTTNGGVGKAAAAEGGEAKSNEVVREGTLGQATALDGGDLKQDTEFPSVRPQEILTLKYLLTWSNRTT